MALLSNMLTDWRHKMIEHYVKGRALDIGDGNAVVLQEHTSAIDQYTCVWNSALSGLCSYQSIFQTRNL